MTPNKLFRLLLLSILIFIVADTFARGGGAHGGGSSGGSRGSGLSGSGMRGFGGLHGSGYAHANGYGNEFENNGGMNAFIVILLFIAITVLLITIPTLLQLKSKLADKIITRAANKDSLWEAKELKEHACNTFYKIQQAWQNQNVDLVKKIITPELYETYKTMLEEMKSRGEKNMLSRIEITETRIIGCEDYLDDSKDRYVAYIKGSMIDYVIHRTSRKILINPEKLIEGFTDTYHFVRNNNSWILEKIDNTVNTLDILKAKIYIEK